MSYPQVGDKVRLRSGAVGTVVGDSWQSQEMVSEVPWLTVEIPRPAFEDSYLICVAADEVTLAPVAPSC